MNRRSNAPALLLTAALALCLAGCEEDDATTGSQQAPVGAAGSAETGGTAAEANPQPANWPEKIPEESSTLGTGMISTIVGKMPPALVLGDALIHPGETAHVGITLGRGFGSTTIKNYPGRTVVITDAAGMTVHEGRTDDDGGIVFERKFDKVGTHFFRAAVDGKVEDTDVRPALFGVYVRQKSTPVVVCDLDKTLVQSGFLKVLIGVAKPFPHAAEVMHRVVNEKKITVLYLTHRNDFFDSMSKYWLREHGFPPGPLFTSDVAGLLEGSGKFKTSELARVKERFPNIRLAIGDKISDSNAYVANKVPSILIPDVDWEKDKADYWQERVAEMRTVNANVTVCRGWFEIEEAIFDGKSFPPGRLIDRLKEMADFMTRTGDDD